MLVDICYILYSYIKVINYNKRKINKHPFDNFALSEKESLKLYYLLQQGI